VLVDNARALILDRVDGTARVHPAFEAFCRDWGTSVRACQPYRAQTKGKVEAGVRYVRGNFWPGLRFSDLADLNRQAQEWLDRTANVRVHGTTGAVPATRLALEQLQPLLGKPAYDTSVISFRRATRDCFVSYAGNYYSVPAEYARQSLKLKETEAGHLVVLNAQDEVITEHSLVAGHRQRIVVPAHYATISQRSQPARRAVATQAPAPECLAGLPAAPQVEARPLSWYDELLGVTL